MKNEIVASITLLGALVMLDGCATGRVFYTDPEPFKQTTIQNYSDLSQEKRNLLMQNVLLKNNQGYDISGTCINMNIKYTPDASVRNDLQKGIFENDKTYLKGFYTKYSNCFIVNESSIERVDKSVCIGKDGKQDKCYHGMDMKGRAYSTYINELQTKIVNLYNQEVASYRKEKK
ncbi:MAG TPA: hypothetical protein CFH83_00885 [Sulfuricurvum kujiense]|uniref:Uncharacterized protein n=1 Tax=Sulfuricurvum kujiense TaxID=148813 RepID=A0A2D3WK68_9BACT|nr:MULTISPECIES: hypothetical protein [Sulfuricurvum]OHD93752.1 MAG: hypothetical protein A2517_07490 [Sulfuricurvum sp. RIFOXYD12_FULL_44_77]DAB39430.1 MAG TPA: hypothetical protein CFH83_00885 [Sulfuricurvum kujiense]